MYHSFSDFMRNVESPSIYPSSRPRAAVARSADLNMWDEWPWPMARFHSYKREEMEPSPICWTHVRHGRPGGLLQPLGVCLSVWWATTQARTPWVAAFVMRSNQGIRRIWCSGSACEMTVIFWHLAIEESRSLNHAGGLAALQMGTASPGTPTHSLGPMKGENWQHLHHKTCNQRNKGKELWSPSKLSANVMLSYTPSSALLTTHCKSSGHNTWPTHKLQV